MTEQAGNGLVAGTVADLFTLMQEPPYPRRGNTYLDTPAQPAAGANYLHKVDNAWWERVVSLYFTFVAAAGGNPRQVLINLLNADGVLFNTTPAVVSVQAGETWNVSADLAGTPGAPAGDSIGAAGTVTSPAAGATITSAPIGQGVWTVSWNVSLSGTVGAPEVNNFKITTTGVNWGNSDNPGAVGGPWIQSPVQVISPAGGTTVAVKTSVLGTTGAVYDAAFSAVPVGAVTTYPQLPNIVLKSSWQLQVQVAGIQAGDQISNIALLVERYPSNWADGSLRFDYEQLARAYGGW